MNRRDLLAVVGIAVAVKATARTVDDTLESGLIHGIYPGEDPYRVESFQRWLDREFAITSLFANAATHSEVRRRVVHEDMWREWEASRVPMLAWQPFPRREIDDAADDPLGDADGGGADPGGANGDEDDDGAGGGVDAAADDRTDHDPVTRTIAEGAYDDVVDGWVTDLVEWLDADDRRRCYLRPFPEMNGDWVPWGAGATTISDFLAAWRRVHDAFVAAFEEEGIDPDRVQWVWNPNATEHGPHDTESYYPGDGYVDWVGVDGYNFGDSQAWSTWQSPAEVFVPMLDRMESLADKPLCIPEFGSSSRRDGSYHPEAKEAWIAAVYDLFREREVDMACWFNVDKETDWAVFGGGRGTDTYRDPDWDVTYEVYSAYREAVRTDEPPASSPGSRLSGEAFRGER